MWWIETSQGCPQSWHFFVLNRIIQLNAVSSTGKACWFMYILAPLGTRLFDCKNWAFHLLFLTTPLFISLYLRHTGSVTKGPPEEKLQWLHALLFTSPTAVVNSIDLSTAGLIDKLKWPWQKHIHTYTDMYVLLNVFSVTWRTDWILKLYEKMHYRRVQLWNAAKRCAWRWILWFHTIIMSPSADNREVYILPGKKIKPLLLKRILFCGSPIVQKPFLMEGCHHLVCSLVIFRNTESRYQCLKLWSAQPFNCQKMDNELIYERCAFACRYYGVMNWFVRGALGGFVRYPLS